MRNLLLFSLFGLSLVLAGCSETPEQQIEKDVKNYYSAVLENDFDTVLAMMKITQPEDYELLNNDQSMMDAHRMTIGRQASMGASLGGIDQVTVNSFNESENSAIIEMAFSDGSRETEQVEVIEIDGRWYLK